MVSQSRQYFRSQSQKINSDKEGIKNVVLLVGLVKTFERLSTHTRPPCPCIQLQAFCRQQGYSKDEPTPTAPTSIYMAIPGAED